jgi:hypothetical protein
MRAEPSCPRCGSDLQAPNLWSSAWRCNKHGVVEPLQPVVQPAAEAVHRAASDACVPLWLLWPLPKGWLVTGVAHAGDERTGARATAVALAGPAPVGGVCDLLLIAEEPGVGLGARYAGLDELDPGAVAEGRVPDGKIQVAGHPTAVWSLPSPPDRAVYVGEAHGCWLWLVLWPESAGFLLIDDFVLTDLRNAGHELDIPFGALSPRLTDSPI